MLTKMDVLTLYRETGAYLEGHFLLASGRHAPAFLQSTTVLQHPKHADNIGTAIAKLYQDETPDFVIGPAMGGVVLAYAVARALNARALFAEKDAGGMTVRSALTIKPGERFLAVEDVVTTGGSLMRTIAAAEKRGGTCLGVGLIIDRGEARFPEGLKVRSLANLKFVSYPADDCPLCHQGVPLEKV